MKILLSLLVLLSSLNVFAGVSIIADFDDTIKITNSKNFFTSLRRSLFSKKAYTGMPEFLQESREYVSEVNVVTASPRIITRKVKGTLKKNEIEVDALILGNNIHRAPKFDFKVSAIEGLLTQTDDAFILLGDDVGEDPEIYDYLLNTYPDRILVSYIHVIKNREVPESAIRYFTSFELAVREYEAGRMSEESVSRIQEKLSQSERMKDLFPGFAYCPKERESFAWMDGTLFKEAAINLTNKFLHYCHGGQVLEIPDDSLQQGDLLAQEK